MRILQLINRFNLGGPTSNVAYLSAYMPEGFETLLVGGEKDYSEDNSLHIIDELGLDPIIIPDMRREVNPWNDFRSYKTLVDIIEEFKPDIIHSHASKAGALGRLAGHRHGVPHLVHTFHGHVFHSYFGTTTTNIYKSVERSLSERSSCIIAISERQKYELVHQFRIAKEDKVKVVPLGFDLDIFQVDMETKRKKFREFYQLEDDTVAIGIVGRLVPIKNHGMFLRAIQLLSKRTKKQVRAFIIGDGETRPELEALCKELGLRFNDPEIDPDDQVTFTSWMKDIDVANAGIDIAALTSKNEGTPVSLIEAQAANRPIVSTRVGGIEDIVKEGETALLSESEDLEHFAQHLLGLTDDESYRKTMGSGGWEFVSQRFHYSRLVSDMAELYKSL